MLMIPAVLLAAGASARMGRPKLVLPTGVPGETFASRILGTLNTAGADDLLMVVRPQSDVDAAIAGVRVPVRILVNSDPETGQLSSLLLALNVIDRPGVSGLLVALVDVPLVSVATVRAVLAAYRASAAPIVRPVDGGRHGHPVIFDRAVFDELRRANPRTGAKAIVQAHLTEIVGVPVADEGAFVDIDTPLDYERWFGRRVEDV